MRAGLYTRISDDRDDTQAGVTRQLEDCERLAATRGWEVAERYTDNDVSAWKGGKRPDYLRMLDDTAGRHIDAVIVWHQDRLWRQPRELEEFFDVEIHQLSGVLSRISARLGTGKRTLLECERSGTSKQVRVRKPFEP